MITPYLAHFQQDILLEEVLPSVLSRGFAHSSNFLTDEQREHVAKELRRFRRNPMRNALHRLETSNPLTPSIHNAFIPGFSEVAASRGLLAAARTWLEGTPIGRLPSLVLLGCGIQEVVRFYGEQCGIASVASWQLGRLVLMNYDLPKGQPGVAQEHYDSNYGLRFVASLGPALMTVEAQQLLVEHGDLTAYAGYDNKVELGVQRVAHSVVARGPRQAVRFDEIQSVIGPRQS